MTDLERQVILGHLAWGRDHAIPIGALAERLGWPRRAVEKAVQQLRSDGHAVCSAGDGVWLGDRADMEATIASLRGRMVSQYSTYLALRRTLRRMRDADQLTLFTEVA